MFENGKLCHPFKFVIHDLYWKTNSPTYLFCEYNDSSTSKKRKKRLCQVDPTVTCLSLIFWPGTFWYITYHKNEKVDYEFFIYYCKMTMHCYCHLNFVRQNIFKHWNAIIFHNDATYKEIWTIWVAEFAEKCFGDIWKI